MLRFFRTFRESAGKLRVVWEANVGEMDKFVVEMCGGIRYTIS